MALDRPTPPPDRPADQPAPDTPTDPWNVAHLTRAQAYESLRAKDSSPPLADQSRDYWAQEPHFADEWRNHQERWPERRSENQPAHLPAVESGQVDAAAEQVIHAEHIISDDVQRSATDCSWRNWLGGFEFRLKSSERIKEKVADKLDAEPDRSAAEVVQGLADAIRYTYCFDTANYTSGYADIKARLEASGYDMYYSKNFWSDSEYKGVNTRWITPEGQRFEVQFHTAESFHAKHEVTHLAYERIRDPRTSEHERSELREFQRDVSRWIPIPDGVSDIPDSKRERP